MDEFSLDYSVSEPKPEPILYVFDGDKTGHTDISAALQSLLDTAGLTGGVVYVPAAVTALTHLYPFRRRGAQRLFGSDP